MVCFYCGSEIQDGLHYCPICNADQKAYNMILKAANRLYNEGLNKAKLRDISGAIESLREALKYNKYHIDARNLLGLCYYEVGDSVKALREWVISKNLYDENPMADRYMAEFSKGGQLDKTGKAINKFNMAIEYCNTGSRDLAKIQLRRVLSQNPRLVEGYQLLALLCMQDGDTAEASKALNKASKIDVRNLRTLHYQQELREMEKAEEDSKKKKKRKQPDTVTFQDGNDSVVMPQASFRELMDNSKASAINILIGLVLGLLVCFFLVVPTVRQNMVNDSANQLVAANEELATKTSNVRTLENQISMLEEELAGYKDQDDVTTSYDHIIEAIQLYNEEDLEGAAKAISTVNPELLKSTAKGVYDTIKGEYEGQVLETVYTEGNEAYAAKEYDEALNKYLEAVGYDEKYDEGNLLYYTAECYRNLSDSNNAIIYYDKYVSYFPEGKYAKKSKDRSEELKANPITDEEGGETEDSNTTNDNTGGAAVQAPVVMDPATIEAIQQMQQMQQGMEAAPGM